MHTNCVSSLSMSVARVTISLIIFLLVFLCPPSRSQAQDEQCWRPSHQFSSAREYEAWREDCRRSWKTVEKARASTGERWKRNSERMREEQKREEEQWRRKDERDRERQKRDREQWQREDERDREQWKREYERYN